MTRRALIWLVVLLVFLAVNLGGGVIAAVAREPLHALVHAVLAVLAAYLAWRRVRGRDARRAQPGAEAERSSVAPGFTDHLTHLEQSVDAVAVEVERVGEGQRFMTRLFAERGAGGGAPEPGGAAARETAAPARDPG